MLDGSLILQARPPVAVLMPFNMQRSGGCCGETHGSCCLRPALGIVCCFAVRAFFSMVVLLNRSSSKLAEFGSPENVLGFDNRVQLWGAVGPWS